MWVIDNILRGLYMMMGFTLIGYSLIHLYNGIKKRIKNRRQW